MDTIQAKLVKNEEMQQTILQALQQIYDLVGALQPSAMMAVTGEAPAAKAANEAPAAAAAEEEAPAAAVAAEEEEVPPVALEEAPAAAEEEEALAQEGGGASRRRRRTSVRRISRVRRERNAPSRYTYRRSRG
jgi:hypothetical protein